jgi:hypothetical protein
MTLFDSEAAMELRPGGGFQDDGRVSLAVDDLLSSAADDLGLDVDGDGSLVLVEGGEPDER